MPAAEALPGKAEKAMFFQKLDESGELLGGSKWKIEYYSLSFAVSPGPENPKDLVRFVIYVEDGLTREKFDELGLRDEERQEAYIRKHFGEYETPSDEVYGIETPGYTDMFGGVDLFSSHTEVQLMPDLAFRDGEIAANGFGSYAEGHEFAYRTFGGPSIDATPITISEVSMPDGYTSCDASGSTSAVFHDDAFGLKDPDNPWAEDNTIVLHEPKTVIDSTGRIQLIDQKPADQIAEEFRYEEKDTDGRFDHSREGANSHLYNTGVSIAFTNCKIPEPTTVTETVTETPEPSTTTVTPPTTTVTLPSTVTTTVTPPATTVTETPKTETTTATTTESATTTVTETPKTETVTETPQRETVTETPTPKTETVTETPQKETVTETPKVSTETKTSTVTAPQVTVTETPNQVTETTTLPQKTVTQQVPTTVVKDQTETVKMPPVTVTETEKQEPVTVSAIPQTVTETVKVPSENTTVVVTEPGEPTTVRETVTEETTSVVPVVVDGPKPGAPAPAPAPAPEQPVETPVEVKQEPANGVRAVLATTGAETNVVLGLGAGVLAMLALVAIVRRKKA